MLMAYTDYKKFEFASAHQLEGHEKCGFLHGHNYTIEAWVSSSQLTDGYGFVIDFGAFKRIASEYDHTGKIIKISSERLAEEIANKIIHEITMQSPEMDISQIKIRIRVWESDHSYAEFSNAL